MFKFVVFGIVLGFTSTLVLGVCDRDRNVQTKDPLYLNYGDGFFYM
jgi:hypothetical protein